MQILFHFTLIKHCSLRLTEEHLLKVQSQVCGENSLFQELHHVAVLFRAEVRKDVVTLRRTNMEQIVVYTHTEKRRSQCGTKVIAGCQAKLPFSELIACVYRLSVPVR